MTAATVAVFEGQLALRDFRCGTHCLLIDRNHGHWSEGTRRESTTRQRPFRSGNTCDIRDLIVLAGTPWSRRPRGGGSGAMHSALEPAWVLARKPESLH